MKNTLGIVLYVLALIAATALFVSCASESQIKATSDLSTAIGAATADGVVTIDEEAVIAEKVEALKDAPGIDWSTVGAALGATALGAFPALRLLLPLIPNRHILGSEPDADVKRAAGLPA